MKPEPVTTLTALLWALKEEANWAWKKSLEGQLPGPTLEAAWENVQHELTRASGTSRRSSGEHS